MEHLLQEKRMSCSHSRHHLLHWRKQDKHKDGQNVKTQPQIKQETHERAVQSSARSQREHSIPVAQVCFLSFGPDHCSASISLQLPLRPPQFQMNKLPKTTNNPITSEDGRIDSQLYVLMRHKGSTTHIKYFLNPSS